MAVEVDELFDVRDTNTDVNKPRESTATRHFVVRGAASETDAENYVRAEPGVPVYGDLIMSGVRCVERAKSGIYDVYKVDVEYKHQEKEDRELEIGEYSIAFDTTGRTTNRKVSIKTIAKIPRAPDVAAGIIFGEIDFEGAIGVSSDGEVAGVDITIETLSLTITKRHNNLHITDTFVDGLAKLTGTVNKKEYLNRAAGELLFRGASGARKVTLKENNGEPEATQSEDLSYTFEVSKNKVNFSVAENFPDIEEKKGWHYLWFYMEERELKLADGTVYCTLPTPRQINIEQVYEEEDFKELYIEDDPPA